MTEPRRSELRLWLTVLSVGAVLVGLGAALGLPLLESAVAALNAGVGLKTAALWSFGITVTLMIVFAIAAGDSLIGEIQFMLAGFLVFFVIITALVAWIF